MTLSSSQLEAFSEVARTGSFSKAAKNLHVTQSALSQRIRNLESELATGLFVRDPSGLRLTAIGEELLRHCQVRENLEAEFMTKVSSSQSSLGGVVRIAGFSSVMRSVIMPSLSELVSGHSGLNLELFVRELRDLPAMLTNNEVDMIVTTAEPFRQEIQSHSLGFEENVLVENTKSAHRGREIFLDHDAQDRTTADFFKLNGQINKKLQRNYLDEVYSVIEGVKRGWGRAVVPRHLVRDEKSLQVVKNHKPLRMQVMIQYFRQPFYPKVHTRIVEVICAKAPEFF